VLFWQCFFFFFSGLILSGSWLYSDIVIAILECDIRVLELMVYGNNFIGYGVTGRWFQIDFELI